MLGYYINLNNRIDRKTHVEKLKKEVSLFKNIERMEACYHQRGDIGCSLSHIKCLNMLLKKQEPYYLIMEDDFCILNSDNFKSFEKEFQTIKNYNNWDLLLLTPRGDIVKKNYISNFNKIINNQTTTGYIVKHNMIEILLENFKESVIHLTNNEDTNSWALDQCWKTLQLKHNFIYYNKIFGGQLPGFSNIENKKVDYNQRFIEQQT
tara:strand:+ start:1609 stop:2229 length:621 start_codon:yes stop_codon:yes gene_type:complete